MTTADEILNTVSNLHDARLEEMKAGFEQAEHEAKIKEGERKVKLRSETIEHESETAGLLDGKTVDIRKRQAIGFVQQDTLIKKFEEELYDLEGTVSISKRFYSEARIERQFQEDLLSAQRAILYASREPLTTA